MEKQSVEVRFNLFDFRFTPLKENESKMNSLTILKSCINRINDERTINNKAIVVDRNENKDGESRPLFVSSAAYLLGDEIYKCRIALIRDNKIPTIVNKKNHTLTSFEELGSNAIAETTNFYICTKYEVPIVCCEFNNHGPRISDIEFYFRHISSHKMLSISKACKAEIHMKVPINDVLNSLRDVLKFRIRVRPQRLNYIYQNVDDSFVGNMNALAGSIDPSYIKVEASFRETGNVAFKKNNKANAFIKKTLKALGNDNQVGDDFDDFYLQFENNEGIVDDFNLLRGKQELLTDCPYISSGNLNTKELYNRVKIKFFNYLEARNP